MRMREPVFHNTFSSCVLWKRDLYVWKETYKRDEFWQTYRSLFHNTKTTKTHICVGLFFITHTKAPSSQRNFFFGKETCTRDVFLNVKERESERERERKWNGERGTETERGRERERGKEKKKERERDREGERDREKKREHARRHVFTTHFRHMCSGKESYIYEKRHTKETYSNKQIGKPRLNKTHEKRPTHETS